jgi:hypothetical protein
MKMWKGKRGHRSRRRFEESEKGFEHGLFLFRRHIVQRTVAKVVIDQYMDVTYFWRIVCPSVSPFHVFSGSEYNREM